MNMTLLNLR